jgi:hypothetical protein
VPLRIAFPGFLFLIALATACGKGSPAQPSTSVAPAAAASGITLVDLRVDGPTTVAPGESTQYMARAAFSDGSQRDVTSEAQWTSTDATVLSVSASGSVSARSNGTAQVRAAFGLLSNGRDVVVVPAGTFRLSVHVGDEQPGVSVYGVRVEVISGPAAGLSSTTDWNGVAVLYGVPQDVQVRFSKDGYAPVTRNIHLANNFSSAEVQLMPSQNRLDLAGHYQLTISSGACDVAEGSFPDALKNRTYTARLWNSGLRINAELSGADFAVEWCPICQENRGNRFTGWTQAQDARFTLAEYEIPWDWNAGIYPNVVERVSTGLLLTISGHAIVSPTSNGFAGTLEGTFAIYSAFDLTYTGTYPIASCRSSSHKFALAR